MGKRGFPSRRNYEEELKRLEKTIGGQHKEDIENKVVSGLANVIFEKVVNHPSSDLGIIDEELEQVLNNDINVIPLGKFKDETSTLHVGALLKKNIGRLSTTNFTPESLEERINTAEKKSIVLRVNYQRIRYFPNICVFPDSENYYLTFGIHRIDPEKNILDLNFNGVFNDGNEVPEYQWDVDALLRLLGLRHIDYFPRNEHFIMMGEFLKNSMDTSQTPREKDLSLSLDSNKGVSMKKTSKSITGTMELINDEKCKELKFQYDGYAGSIKIYPKDKKIFVSTNGKEVGKTDIEINGNKNILNFSIEKELKRYEIKINGTPKIKISDLGQTSSRKVSKISVNQEKRIEAFKSVHKDFVEENSRWPKSGECLEIGNYKSRPTFYNDLNILEERGEAERIRKGKCTYIKLKEHSHLCEEL